MKCKNCKNRLPDDAEFCNFCGAAVKKGSKLKIFLVVVILILFAAAAAAAAFIFLNGGSGNILNDSTDGTDAVETNVSIISTDDDEPELWLTVDAEDAAVGSQSRVSFVVQVPDLSYKDAVIVNEDDGTELVTLTSQRKTEDGTVELYGNYSFVPKESDFMQVRAYSGDKYSQVGFVSVTEPVTDEENDEFVQVYTDLADYVDQLDDDISGTELLDAVESWLNSSDRVSDITRDEKNVYYTTNGGIRASFTTEGINNDILAASSTSQYKSDTDAVENYDAYEKDSDALKRSGNENITYDKADITITNNNTVMLRPTYYADDGFQADYFDETLDDIRDARFLEGGIVADRRGSESVMSVIAERELLDYGNIYLCAHGGYQPNSYNYYFVAMDTTDKNEWKSFEKKYKDLLSKSDGNDYTWKISYSSSKSKVFDEDKMEMVKETHYCVYVSSRYIMETYQNYTFDNPIVWMISCYGTIDPVFNTFLMNHGVKSIIGTKESFWSGTAGELLINTAEQMYQSETAVRFSNVLNSITTNNVLTVSGSGNTKLELGDYCEFLCNPNGSLSKKEISDINDETVNGCIVDRERLEAYYNAKGLDSFEIGTIYTVDDGDNEAGTYDVSTSYSNTIFWRGSAVPAVDFVYGGTGTLSGTVKKGTAVRTIHPDGTYDDVTNADEPLAYANIEANRFLNQIFYNNDVDDYNDEATTDKDGKFTFDNIDWGLYTVDTEYSSYKGEASIILTSNSTDGGEIIAYGGNAAISGYVQGYTDEDNTETEFLERAKISLVSVDEIDGEKKTYSDASASDGSFEIKDIEAGTYTVTISHSDYEDYTSTITFKNGYEYVYEEDCFILENNISDISVVLVLDVSGSMSGTPIASLKSAVNSFADSMLETENGVNCKVSIAAFSGSSSVVCGSTKYRSNVYSASAGLKSGGGTNFEAGLSDAYSILKADDTAKKKILVLMSDGCPNQGKEGSSLIEYADKIKDDGIIICTQGFFSSLTSEKSDAQALMEALASEGYHYEIDSENDLIDFYNDLADQISGQEYIHQRIACPVDVSVTYNGETLDSSEDSLCTRTSFGTLTFEEEDETDGDTDNRIKILRLKSGVDYNVRIVGTGSGKMDYTVSYPDEEGNYSDTRKFRSIKITDDTVIDTVAGDVKKSVLNVDSNGDGKYDTVYQAKANEYGKEAPPYTLIYMGAAGAAALLMIVLIIVLIFKLRK